MYSFNVHFMSLLASGGHERVVDWTAKNSTNLFDYNIILFPLNNAHHWTLIVVELSCSVIRYFDSLGWLHKHEDSWYNPSEEVKAYLECEEKRLNLSPR